MVTEWVNTKDNSEWATPQALFDELNEQYHFTLDPCATDENHKCEKYFTKADNGLKQNWDGEIVFMNPPYHKRIGDWIRKAANTKGVVVALLPSKTDTGWFHNYIYGKAQVTFIRGRLHYNESKRSAPFGSMIVVWNNNKEE